MEQLPAFDVIDAFILRYAHQLSAKQMTELLGISCSELNERYDNLFFIHVACQTKIDQEYHRQCKKLLRSFPPVIRAEGLIKKQRSKNIL